MPRTRRIDFLESDAPVDLHNWSGEINTSRLVVLFAYSDPTKGLGKDEPHAQFKRKKLRWHLGVQSAMVDVGEDLQRFWRKFSPDTVHVPD